MIANDVAEKLTDSAVFSEVSAVAPGFLNLKVKDSFVCEYFKGDGCSGEVWRRASRKEKTIVVDYGGPNVAKPLHVGHLRSAVIGESIKRINRYKGHRVIGDVHLGDWGLQMGLIITELKARKPELPYFDESFTGEYPQEAPFTVSELEEIYPTASGKSKEDPAYKEARWSNAAPAKAVTVATALWKHIIAVSVADLKKTIATWMWNLISGREESDADPLIPGLVSRLKESGLAYESQGAGCRC